MTDNTARAFAARVAPFTAGAFVNVHYTVDVPGRDKPLWNGKPCTTTKGVADAVEYALGKGKGKDIYACMSSQREHDTRTSKSTGKTFKIAMRSADNAVELRSLFVDIDVKPDAYKDTREALEALNAFREATDLPRPTMAVLTGSGGLHVYWVLDTPLPVKDWLPLAHALASAIKKHGLKADTQCTVDAARILRIPGTFNHKHNPPKPVKLLGTPLDFDYTLERIKRALDPYVGAITLRSPAPELDTALFPQGAPVEDDELGAGIEDARPPVDIEKIDCPFIIDALVQGGKGYGNPLWNLTTLIATFCEDGRAKAHLMASGHDEYRPETTDLLFDRKEREKREKGLGWPSCKTIDIAGSRQCATCPHKNDGKTPLSFYAAPVVLAPIAPGGPAATALDLLPDGYRITPAGVVLRRISMEDGSVIEIPVFPYPIRDAFVQGGAMRSLNYTALEGSGVQKLSIPFEVICNKEALAKKLSISCILPDEALKEARKFMISWTEKLIMAKDVVVTTPAFGWVDGPKGVAGFSFGGFLWGANGISVPAVEVDHEIARQYGVTGAPAPWIEAANMVLARESPALNALLLSGFTAPLVKLLGFRGLLMSLYSQESGVGKTTAMQVAQAVWGSPRLGIQQLSDTKLSVFDRAEKIRALPVYWDEIKTEEEIKQFVSIIFQLTSGRGKSRLRADMTQRERGLWDTLMVSCSNDTVLDHIASANNTTLAGVYRVFEFSPAPPIKGQIGIGAAMRILAKLDNNYGHMGLKYAQYLGDNHQRIYEEIGAKMSALEEMTRCTPPERNWVGLIACLMQAARCVNEMGDISIPEADLLAYLLEQLDNMRSQATNQTVDMKNTQNVSDIIGRFFASARARNTLITDRVNSGRGRPRANAVRIWNDLTKLDTLQVHMGAVDRIVKVDRTALRTWLRDHNYSQGVIIDEMRKQFRMREDIGALGGGTPYATISMNLFTFDCVGTPLDEMIPEEPK